MDWFIQSSHAQILTTTPDCNYYPILHKSTNIISYEVGDGNGFNNGSSGRDDNDVKGKFDSRRVGMRQSDYADKWNLFSHAQTLTTAPDHNNHPISNCNVSAKSFGVDNVASNVTNNRCWGT